MANEIIHIVCPNCNATNRASKDKLASGDHGKCGRCGHFLFEGRPLALDTEGFERHTTKGDIPLLVDFWADWSGPCKKMAPMFEAAAKTLEPAVRLIKIDTESEQGLAARYDIRSIPTLVIFKGGKEIARQSGVMDTVSIVHWSRQYL